MPKIDNFVAISFLALVPSPVAGLKQKKFKARARPGSTLKA